MITLRGLSKEDFVLSQLFFIGEGDTVDALQGVVLGVAEEVRRGALSDHERLDLAGVGDVGADAKVDHRTAAVDGGGGAVGDLGLNELLLVFVVPPESSHVRESIAETLGRAPTPNISMRVSLLTTSRSNFCFSLMTESVSFSSGW